MSDVKYLGLTANELAVIATNLEHENAKLREERDYYKALWEHATVTDCELRRVHAAWKEDREKNAKLRELARNLWRVIPADVTGVVIGANTDHPTYYKFDEAFRELGVEP